MDEFDIEITNLNDRPAPTDTAPTDAADHQASEATLIGPRAFSTPPQSHRQRLFRTLAIVLPVLLALALILGANPITRAALASLLHPPIATFANSTGPGAEQFDLVHVAPWGDLRIDGQSVPQKQVLQRFRAIRLSPGAHTLDYSAPPFPSLHCTLTVPANPTRDTCPLTQNADDLYMVGSDTARMLDLRAGFTNLSGQQLATLTQAAEAALLAASPNATVAPSDHYLTAGGKVAVNTNTSAPIQATLIYQLDTTPPHVLPGFPPLSCTPLCLYSYLIAQMPDEWGVVAPVELSWHYVMPYSPLVNGPVAPGHETEDVGIPLHITWQYGWRITPLKNTTMVYRGGYGDPNCVPAGDALAQAIPHIPATSSVSTYMRSDFPANGCLIIWYIVDGAHSGLSYLLYRFGVLLAANDEARHIFPTLPVASASEQSLARQLATQG